MVGMLLHVVVNCLIFLCSEQLSVISKQDIFYKFTIDI